MTENVFLVNPAAANGSTGRRWPEIAHQAAGAGLEGDALLSERRGHLGELAREAALDGSRLLVVVGGDGSINEVVNGLAGIENPPAVALIPRGTGGDFVRTFGIPDDIAAASRVALTGETQAIDLGRVSYRSWDGTDGSALFANVASAGMSGAIAQRANDTSKALGAKASYLWATFAVFAGWSAVETRLTVDDETRSGRMFDVVVANGRFFGGGMKMCPDARPRRRPPRRGHDRRRHEARPRADDAEDLPRHPSAPPEGGGAPRPRRHGRDRRARAGRARRRAAGHDPGALRGAARGAAAARAGRPASR